MEATCETGREALQADHVGRQEAHLGLDHVRQLADVARPLVRLELVVHARSQLADALPLLLGELRQVVLREDVNVVGAIAERRELDGQDAQPVQEVHAELPLVDELRQIAVRGGNDARVNGALGRAAEPRDDALLQDAQELGLHVHRHLADFVEQDGPRPRLLELARVPVSARAGERAAVVPEQLGLEQLARDGRDVDPYERLARARAPVWIACAMISLPVPLSPVMRTVESMAAACLAMATAARMGGLVPTTSLKL